MRTADDPEVVAYVQAIAAQVSELATAAGVAFATGDNVKAATLSREIGVMVGKLARRAFELEGAALALARDGKVREAIRELLEETRLPGETPR